MCVSVQQKLGHTKLYTFFAKWDNNHLDTHSQSKAWQHIYIKSFIYRLDLHNLFSFASLQRFGISWYSTEKFSLKKYLCFLGCTSTIWTVSIIYSVVAVEVQLFWEGHKNLRHPPYGGLLRKGELYVNPTCLWNLHKIFHPTCLFGPTRLSIKFA